jgi:hypothetical protein
VEAHIRTSRKAGATRAPRTQEDYLRVISNQLGQLVNLKKMEVDMAQAAVSVLFQW